MTIKTSKEFLDLLNKAVEREIQVSAQYMLQHTKIEKLSKRVIPENILLGEKTTYEVFGEILKKLSIEEMKHLGSIMERIYVLGGKATTKPSKITIGESLKEFAEINMKAEEEALALYRQIVEMAKSLGDVETKLMFEKIYSDEEAHYLVFQDYLDMEDEPDLGETPESEWRKIFNEDYIVLLNEAVAAEFSAVVQYTNQHEKASAEKMRRKKTALEVITDKNKAAVISDMLKPIFLQEMEHLEKILERIYEVDREAIADVNPKPEIGDKVEDFIKINRKSENYAILLYRKIIMEASKVGDIKTKKLFEDILVEEEEHYWAFDDYLP